MIKKLMLTADFSAVPYLPTSALWQRHAAEGLTFVLDKPNVVVGPNGSGKSALLTLLSLQVLTHLSGETALDEGYTRGRESDAWWGECTWREGPTYLPGCQADTDNAPALFYRPGHIPGNDHSVVAAMMCGYGDEARAYGDAVEDKSSGQGCRARLERLTAALAAPALKLAYQQINWQGGVAARDLSKLGWVGPWDYRAEVLKARCRSVAADAMPLILMDEPEQSLDALAELALWQALANTSGDRQVIVATHSLYPFLNPDRFHLIESVPGYVDAVRTQLNLAPTAQ